MPSDVVSFPLDAKPLPATPVRAPSTRHKGTTYLWSDGVHYVRRATEKDRHALRFVVRAHKTNASPLNRRAATEAAAIEIGEKATKHWLRLHPADAPVRPDQAPTPPVASSTVVLQPFASTRFDCVYANPIAQVWMCTSLPGDQKPVGRKRAGGRPAEQTRLPHILGECAVLLGNTPVRTRNGNVRVFANRSIAEEAAENLYEQADEDERLSWKEPSSRVAASLNFEVHFNPLAYGAKHPFIIWFPRFNRPVYVNSSRAPITRPGVSLSKLADPQLRIDAEAARARARAEDRQPLFEERPKTFRSIWEAEEEMQQSEKRLRGETVR